MLGVLLASYTVLLVIAELYNAEFKSIHLCYESEFSVKRVYFIVRLMWVIVYHSFSITLAKQRHNGIAIDAEFRRSNFAPE